MLPYEFIIAILDFLLHSTSSYTLYNQEKQEK